MDEPRVTRPLAPAARARLLTMVQRGELAALQRIGISRTALMRALSGLPVYGGTRMAIEAALADDESR